MFSLSKIDVNSNEHLILTLIYSRPTYYYLLELSITQSGKVFFCVILPIWKSFLSHVIHSIFFVDYGFIHVCTSRCRIKSWSHPLFSKSRGKNSVCLETNWGKTAPELCVSMESGEREGGLLHEYSSGIISMQWCGFLE